MKKIALIAILLAGICSVGKAQFSSKDLFLTKSFNGAAFTKITVETSHGDIDVSSVSATESKVEVFVRPSNSDLFMSKEEIQKKMDEYYKLDVSVSGDMLNVIVSRKKEFMNDQRSLSISFRIYAGLPGWLFHQDEKYQPGLYDSFENIEQGGHQFATGICDGC